MEINSPDNPGSRLRGVFILEVKGRAWSKTPLRAGFLLGDRDHDFQDH